MPLSKKNNLNNHKKITTNSSPIIVPELVSEMEKRQYAKLPIFTTEGFKILKLPSDLRRQLTDLWLNNRYKRVIEDVNGLSNYIKK